MQLVKTLPATQVLCSYVNTSQSIQVARITEVPGFFLERTIFPGQRILFECLPTAHLEIHTGMLTSAILTDKIPCDRLQVAAEYADLAA
jgi:hypothetical protein